MTRDHVTPDQFRAGLAELEGRIADLEARGALLAQTAAMAAIAVRLDILTRVNEGAEH